MNNDIPVVTAIIIAVIAIVVAGFNVLSLEDTSDFVTKSEQLELVAIVKDFHNTDPILCDSDPECVKFFARKFITDAQINSVINDIVAVQEQLKEEIIVNRDNFNDNHPFNFEPEEMPVVGETEAFSNLLEITLEKENWICAETVVFTGSAVSFQGQVSATVNEPDGNIRYLNAIVYPSGEYRFSFGTPFDCQVGEYGVYVQQGHKKSQTVSFTITKGE